MHKAELLEQLRDFIRHKAPDASETDRAEADLRALSYQSTSHSHRHVWIDFDADKIGIDLEDWNTDDEWDNTISHVTAATLDEAARIIQGWLANE
jgi:hypothetical protein